MKKLPESVQRKGPLPCSQKPTIISYSNLYIAYPVLSHPSYLNPFYCVLMYVPRVLNSSLTRPTNAQHIYTNNILYIVSTSRCFDAST